MLRVYNVWFHPLDHPNPTMTTKLLRVVTSTESSARNFVRRDCTSGRQGKAKYKPVFITRVQMISDDYIRDEMMNRTYPKPNPFN